MPRIARHYRKPRHARNELFSPIFLSRLVLPDSRGNQVTFCISHPKIIFRLGLLFSVMHTGEYPSSLSLSLSLSFCRDEKIFPRAGRPTMSVVNSAARFRGWKKHQEIGARVWLDLHVYSSNIGESAIKIATLFPRARHLNVRPGRHRRIFVRLRKM